MSNKRDRQKARQPTTAKSAFPTGAVITSRQVMKALNTGYDGSGANITKGSLRGYQPMSSSPQSDIDANRPLLVSRSRDAFMCSPIATSAILTQRTHVIGAGLRLRARVNAKLLGISPDEAKEWQKYTEAEFDLWASSKHCDLQKISNYYDAQDVTFIGYMINGDGWAAFKYRKPTPDMPYMLRLHLFESDRVSNPNSASIGSMSPLSIWAKNPANGNRLVNGVEIDSDGAVVAYWISNRHPYDPTNLYVTPEWSRVEAFGKESGRPNILQVFHAERPDQYRGVPYLAPVIESLKQVTRYTEAELTAAVIKAFFTLFFTQTAGMTPQTFFAVNETVGEKDKVSIDASDFELGAGSMNVLPPGFDVTSVDASRTLSTFDDFTSAVVKQIAAALEQPYEVLMKSFNSSYSASRAALLQAWAAYKMRRIWFVRDFCEPVYETWLTEAVAIGRIKAPGFFDDPLIKKAWCGSEWYGPVMGQLDPVKEATGAALRIQHGLSTGEKEAAETTGTDFDSNIQQRALELKSIEETGYAFSPITTIQINEKGGSEEK